ncbi:MAG TPA: serine acetyltransferase [bacterium]|jgi:serine O-acetyltransferase|nr:serine O-acetyltransferase EpsC [bacterium]HPY13842.1 serine acetyltransferase [bacterium]
MDIKKRDRFINVVGQLCCPGSYGPVVNLHSKGAPMPSRDDLERTMELLRAIVFPGFYMESDINAANISFYTGAKLDKVFSIMKEQIKRGLCFECQGTSGRECVDCDTIAEEKAFEFIEDLPEIRRMLALDVEASYEGDPAAINQGETIFCYPGVRMLTSYRIAHSLFKIGVPLIPRIITEMAHSETGIDIHPEATIGERFFMDHGTGIVIGGTSIIGRNVKIYQGVTLGAKSFPKDAQGNPVKGVPRHPIVEDDVVIYSNATILGRITIGKGAVIGGNTWVMENVPAGARILAK